MHGRTCLWRAFRLVSHPDLNRYRRWIASLAILAVLANALVPAIAQALVASPGSWAEVCTSTGARWVRIGSQVVKAGDGSERRDELPGSTHEPACAFCISHATGFAPPTGETPIWAAAALPQGWAHAAIGAWPPAQTAAWSWPALRGPPGGLTHHRRMPA